MKFIPVATGAKAKRSRIHSIKKLLLHLLLPFCWASTASAEVISNGAQSSTNPLPKQDEAVEAPVSSKSDSSKPAKRNAIQVNYGKFGWGDYASTSNCSANLLYSETMFRKTSSL